MRVLVIPDKFKGTLTALQAAEAIARGWRERRPADEMELLPMSDGGDGFGEVLGGLVGAQPCVAEVLNAAHENARAEWWWSDSRETAVIESAKVIGLAMLPPDRFHPFELDTRGLGQLLRQMGLEHAGKRVIIGIGGSATNDAGFGMARGLGYRFEDASGHPIERWVELDRLCRIASPKTPVSFGEVIIASDVQNPLLGPEGASRVYGPQKGLRPEDFPIADRAFERFTEVVRKDLGIDCAEEQGTGAAGGLGYGLRAFLGGHFKPGFEIFAEASALRERISAVDLIITGEGAIDRQTQMGKGTGAIANLAKATGKRCVGLAGFVAEGVSADLFELALGIVPYLATAEEAKRDAAKWLSHLSTQAAGRVKDGL